MDSTKTITHVGLCAGYGGIELGLKRVIPNLRTVALCEIEAFAIANLVAKMEAGLMDPAPIWPDLKTFPWQSFRDRVDILTGGYPCQPFSSAGKRAGKDDPRHLWPWIADGIASMRPSVCFFENVEGHISLGLSNVIEDLGRMGYRTTWGIFSATEVGAPHQRKRVFILAHRFGSGLEGMLHDIAAQGREDAWRLASGCGKLGGEVWPSRPNEPQYPWEPPRVVGNTKGWQDHRREPGDMGLEASQGGRGDDAVDGAGQAVENSICGGGKESIVQSADLSSEPSWCDAENLREPPNVVEDAKLAVDRSEARRNKANQPDAARSASGYCGSSERVAHARQTESGVGLLPSRNSSKLGSALTDDVDNARLSHDAKKANARELLHGMRQEDGAEENIMGHRVSKFIHPEADVLAGMQGSTRQAGLETDAYEVLLALWNATYEEDFQWPSGGPSHLLASAVLQSGMRLDRFPQRICYFVWCIQEGHKAEGVGLPEMWVTKTAWDSPCGQEPTQQFRRELAYALCVLSYRSSLERGEGAVEGEVTVQNVRESGAAKWVLSETLVSIQEVWKSQFNEENWTSRPYSEAALLGSNRTDELRLLGNGVVPATAELAFRTLHASLAYDP